LKKIKQETRDRVLDEEKRDERRSPAIEKPEKTPKKLIVKKSSKLT